MNILCLQKISAQLDFVDKMIDAGVRVLKIEGRARSAEYVKEVSSCYDEAVRAIEKGTYYQRKNRWVEEEAFNCI